MSNQVTKLRRRYLELLKAALSDKLYRPPPESEIGPDELARAESILSKVRAQYLDALDTLEMPRDRRLLLEFLCQADAKTMATFLRENSPRAHTLVSGKALDNVQECVTKALEEKVQGDLMECGSWRGGVPILMRAVLDAYNDRHRQVWLADSFQGLPAPDPQVDVVDAAVSEYLQAIGGFAVTQKEVKDNFMRYGLLDKRVRFLPGWFEETLPKAPLTKLAVLRLDGDFYASTRTALEHLYPKLSPGGFLIIDDYSPMFGALRAVDEYRNQHGIRARLTKVDDQVHYWRKPYSR